MKTSVEETAKMETKRIKKNSECYQIIIIHFTFLLLRFELAITLYTEAMRFAPCNPVLLEGEALAWAAANRSAAFYQQQQYRQALEDIEIAIAAGYPTNSIYKLYIRRCKCELEMGRIGKAQEVAIRFSSSIHPTVFISFL